MSTDFQTKSRFQSHSGTNELSKRKASASASKILRVIRAEQEPKFLDTTSGYSNVSAAGALTNLTAIGQGVGGSQRTGDFVRLSKLVIRVAGYQNNTTALQFPNIVRVLVVRWNLNNAVSPPAVGDVLTTASTLSIGQSITSTYNSLQLKEGAMEILHDSYHFTSLNSNSFAFCKELDVSRFEIDFNPTANTGFGHIYVLMQSDDAGVVSPCPSVAFSSRVVYDD